MAEIVYSSMSRELVVHPTLSGLRNWLESRALPQDPVGLKYEGRDLLTRFVEMLNPGAWVTVTEDCYYVNHHIFEWGSSMGGCLPQHILERTRGRYISATEALRLLEEISVSDDHQ